MSELFEHLLGETVGDLTVRVVSPYNLVFLENAVHLVVTNIIRTTMLKVQFLSSCPTSEGGRYMGQWVAQAVKHHQSNGAVVEATDPKIEADYPAIFDFLTCNVGEGGKPRAVGSLTVFARTGSWHTCLKDRQTKKTWWGEGDTVDSAMKALDAALQGR